MVTAELDKSMRQTRITAKTLGFKYPAIAPEEVCLGPRKHPNHLAYTSLSSFTLPHLMDVLDGCSLNLTKVGIRFILLLWSTSFYLGGC